MSKTVETGPELNAQIAVEVMGYVWMRAQECEWFSVHPVGKRSCAANRMRQGLAWLVSPDGLRYYDLSRYEIVDGSGKNVCNTEYVYLPGESRWGYPPAFSTEWSAAGEVLEKLRTYPYVVQMAFMLNIGGQIKADDQVTLPSWYPDGAWGMLYLTPLAICLAALAAVRAGKGKCDG